MVSLGLARRCRCGDGCLCHIAHGNLIAANEPATEQKPGRSTAVRSCCARADLCTLRGSTTARQCKYCTADSGGAIDDYGRSSKLARVVPDHRNASGNHGEQSSANRPRAANAGITSIATTPGSTDIASEHASTPAHLCTRRNRLGCQCRRKQCRSSRELACHSGAHE